MSSILGIDASIGWAHWKVRGGWKTALWWSGGFLVVLFILIQLTVRMNPRTASNVLAGWRLALLWLQGIFLVFFGASRVAAAVRSDITSRMIESHRLMPVPPLVAVNGYLWGPTFQPIFLGAATFILGLVVTMWAGMHPSVWIGPNLILASFAVFVWIVMAFFASFVRAGAGWILALSVFGMLGNNVLAYVLPGLVLLITPMHRNTVFQATIGSADLPWSLVAAVMAQIYIGAILYVGAARKYRRSEETALGIYPGLLLLVGWIALCAMSIVFESEYLPSFIYSDESGRIVRFICAILSAILVALAPLANAARMSGSIFRTWRIAFYAALIIGSLSLLVLPKNGQSPQAPSVTFYVVLSLLLTCGSILRITYRIATRGWLPVSIWILLIGPLPVIADSMLWGLSNSTEEYAPTALAGISPGGALVIAWTRNDASLIPGLLAQAGFALFWAIVYYLGQRRGRRLQPSSVEEADGSSESGR